MDIRGTTKITGLFGCPVKHTFSPAMHNAAFEALKMDMVYLPFEVSPEDLEGAVASLVPLGVVGVNVTIPHKEAVIRHLDEVSETAELIGSVNTITVRDRRLRGDNTDAYGFATSLQEEAGFDLKGKRVFVMGAGGASRAVSFQSALAGAAELVIADVDASKAESLAGAVSSRFDRCRVQCSPASAGDVEKALAGADLFVNATPIGMEPGDPPLIRVEWLDSATVVFDAIYNPLQTRLLREAGERGLKTVNGIGMLLHQGARAFELFTGVPPPVDVMFQVLQSRFSGG